MLRELTAHTTERILLLVRATGDILLCTGRDRRKLSSGVDGPESSPDEEQPKSSSNGGLFIAAGFGTGFIVPGLLQIEVPRFQQMLPEGVCLAAYFNVAAHVGIIAVVVHVLFGMCCPRLMLSHRTVVGSLFMVVGSTIGVASLTWKVHHVLVGASFIGGVAGSLFAVVLMPWVASHGGQYIQVRLS